MGKYLEKFRGTLSQRQSNQIFKLLNKQRAQGQVRTVEDFNRRLDTLIRELTGTVMTPSLKLFMAEEDDSTSSEQFNFMMERVQDDLEAAFEEALNVGEVQISHEALVRDVILKNLRAGVAELESKIGLYEFLNKDSHGFDSNVFSTFRESKEGRTQRGTSDTGSLFVDPRTKELFPTTQDATIELVGERLTLAVTNQNYHTIRGVKQIFDATSPQTDQIVTPPDMNLSNIIDDTSGTYWIQSWLFPTAQKYIKAKLELDLGVNREINFIEIEPVTSNGFYLESIYYLDGSGVFQQLPIAEHLLTGPVGLCVRKFSTRILIFTFRNENGQYSTFEYNGQNTLLGQSQIALSNPLLQPDKAGISATMNDIVSSGDIKDLIDYQVPSKNVYQGYEFKIGLDNIRVGLSDYKSDSIYVATPLEGSSNALLGLRTIETRPYLDDITAVLNFTDKTYDDPTYYFVGSIEHWITKQDYNANNVLVRTTSFPILPMGVQRIIHERLILTDKSDNTIRDPDIGNLMFYTTRHRTGNNVPVPGQPDGNIKVYRNGIEIPNLVYSGGLDGWYVVSTEADTIPNNSRPMQMRIQILGSLPGDIHTVSYDAMTSSVQVVAKPPYEEVIASNPCLR